MRSNASSRRGFTLVELLVVIAIIGILTAIGIPSLKGLSSSNDVAAANRQLRDDLSYARMRAINERTTVYVVFVSPDILRQPWSPSEIPDVAKHANLQYTGYALYAERSLGDQPGPGTPRYLTEWRTLPDGIFIPTNKFNGTIPDTARLGLSMTDRPFFFDATTFARFPFPNTGNRKIRLPYIAFDYLGRLTKMEDVVIPVSKGSLIFPQESRDLKQRISLDPAEVIETPKNNYTNNPVVRIDWVTGRARTEKPETFDYAARQ